MRLVADNENEYKHLALVQKLMTQRFKEEKEAGSAGPLFDALKAFINTPIEKSWVKPGTSAQVANTTAVLETDEPELFIPYLVHAAVNRKKVAIEYWSDKKGISKRLIEPFSWRGDTIVAWCHEAGAWRQFKPINMRRVAVTELPFDREEDVEIRASDATKKYILQMAPGQWVMKTAEDDGE